MQVPKIIPKFARFTIAKFVWENRLEKILNRYFNYLHHPRLLLNNIQLKKGLVLLTNLYKIVKIRFSVPDWVEKQCAQKLKDGVANLVNI